MKKNLLGVVAIFLLLNFFSCATKSHWAGVYTGTILSADGEETNVKITLNKNQTYKIEYQDYTNSGDYPVFYGTINWNPEKDIVIIDIENEGELPSYYKIGDEALIHLVVEGSVMSGKLGSDYLLYKQK